MIMEGGGTTAARKVMVVADPTRESAGALQYALSHEIVDYDTLILFHVESSNPWKTNPLGVLFWKPGIIGGAAASHSHMGTAMVAEGGGGGEEGVEFLDAMKEACMKAQPKVKVVVVTAEMAEGKDKASVILGMSITYKADLLIVGHKRSFSNAILGVKRAGLLRDTAEFLIFNSKCSCIAVQKKGQNGGYLLNSKKHKNFWVLA